MIAHETPESISRWAEKTFGPVAAVDAAKRCLEELLELIEVLEKDPTDPKAHEEVADVYITLARVSEVLGVDVPREVDRKMVINRARRWVVNGDGTGQHA